MGWYRRSRSRRPTTKAAAGCRSSRSRARAWSRRPSGSRGIAIWSCARSTRDRKNYRSKQGSSKMRRLTKTTLAFAGFAMGAIGFAGGASAQQKEILIGSQCDRTGPTQLVGTIFCPAVQDYVNLINSKGGIDGYKVVINELDNNYQVPPAIEEYERHKQQGIVSTLIWGTPQAE